MPMEILHYSVLHREVLEHLGPAVEHGGLLIDCTLGEGGHSELFLRTFSQAQVVGLDRDSEIMEKAEKRLSPFSDRFKAVNIWFDEFFADPHSHGVTEKASAILFDFGISLFHYEASGRGFSFSKDEPLDMRLDREGSVTAEVLVNTLRKEELADLLYELGEERYSRRIAAAICSRRQESAITGTAELADIIRGSVPPNYRHGRIHPATRTFQALRIAVNGELERIDRVLERAVGFLKPGGVIGVISFHSLEDRRVKQTFRKLANGCVCPPEAPRCTCGGKPTIKLVQRKPFRPGELELGENPASRSARLRAAVKLPE